MEPIGNLAAVDRVDNLSGVGNSSLAADNFVAVDIGAEPEAVTPLSRPLASWAARTIGPAEAEPIRRRTFLGAVQTSGSGRAVESKNLPGSHTVHERPKERNAPTPSFR